MKLPGVPPQGSPNAEAFRISFWASLYSGALYSVVIGLIVGLTVWFVQQGIENRRAHSRFERELALFRGRLRSTFAQPDVLHIDSAIKTAPPTAIGAAKLITEHPIDLWYESIPKRRPFLDVIKDLQRVYSKFVEIAGKLDFKLGQSVRIYNASRNVIAVNDPTYRSFFIARIHGISASNILPWIDRNENAIPQLEASYTVIAADAGVKELVQPYFEARTQLLASLETLKRALE